MIPRSVCCAPIWTPYSLRLVRWLTSAVLAGKSSAVPLVDPADGVGPHDDAYRAEHEVDRTHVVFVHSKPALEIQREHRDQAIQRQHADRVHPDHLGDG